MLTPHQKVDSPQNVYYLPYKPKKKGLNHKKLMEQMNEKYYSMKISEVIPLKQRYLNFSPLSISTSRALNQKTEESQYNTYRNPEYQRFTGNKSFRTHDFRSCSVKLRPSLQNSSFQVLQRPLNVPEITRIKQRLAFRNQPVSSRVLEQALCESPTIEIQKSNSRNFPKGGELLIKFSKC